MGPNGIRTCPEFASRAFTEDSHRSCRFRVLVCEYPTGKHGDVHHPKIISVGREDCGAQYFGGAGRTLGNVENLSIQVSRHGKIGDHTCIRYAAKPLHALQYLSIEVHHPVCILLLRTGETHPHGENVLRIKALVMNVTHV